MVEEMEQAVATPSRRVWRLGYWYSKARIILAELAPFADRQHDSLQDPATIANRARLMKAKDQVNATWGKGTVQPASSGIERPWKLAANFHSRATPRRLTNCCGCHERWLLSQLALGG